MLPISVEMWIKIKNSPSHINQLHIPSEWPWTSGIRGGQLEDRAAGVWGDHGEGDRRQWREEEEEGWNCWPLIAHYSLCFYKSIYKTTLELTYLVDYVCTYVHFFHKQTFKTTFLFYATSIDLSILFNRTCKFIHIHLRLKDRTIAVQYFIGCKNQ